jgi:hypothetical protein
LLPAKKLAPFTVKVAVAADPEAIRAAAPRDTLPVVNITVPVGGVVPVAGFTVAINTVEELCAKLAGFAATDAVVEISGAAKVRVIAADVEAVKPALPV